MSSRNFKSSPKSRLSIESLETRQMMAGDVRAQLVDGTIFLSEASPGSAEAVQAFQLSNGQIRVEGLTAADGGNDTAKIDAFAIDHVMLRMGSGNDTLRNKNLFAYRLIALGEDGFDRISGLASAKTQFRDILGWEMRDGQLGSGTTTRG